MKAVSYGHWALGGLGMSVVYYGTEFDIGGGLVEESL